MTTRDLTWDPLRGVPAPQRAVYTLREEGLCAYAAECTLDEAQSRNPILVTDRAALMAEENVKLLRKGYTRAVRFKALTELFGGIKPRVVSKVRARRAAKEVRLG